MRKKLSHFFGPLPTCQKQTQFQTHHQKNLIKLQNWPSGRQNNHHLLHFFTFYRVALPSFKITPQKPLKLNFPTVQPQTPAPLPGTQTVSSLSWICPLYGWETAPVVFRKLLPYAEIYNRFQLKWVSEWCNSFFQWIHNFLSSKTYAGE